MSRGFLAIVLGAGALAVGVAGASAAPANYRWVTSNPGGAAAGEIIYVVHGSPRDLTDFDIHLACVPGQNNVTMGLRTRGFGQYKPQALKGAAEEARIFVDGRLVARQSVNVSAWDEGVETNAEAGALSGLLDAMEKGRTLRAELPKAKTANISLAGFAPLSKMMRKHCRL